MVKPFSPRELVARVRSVLRRAGPATEPIPTLEFDTFVIDGEARQVTVRGEAVEMPPMEFDLLLHFAQSPKRVFSRSELLEQVWGSNAEWQDPSTVTVHIRRLRQKIEVDPDDPKQLVTVWGRGYRFEP